MKKYGLQLNKIQDDHYYLGGGFIGTEEINPNGQWDNFLPPEELQSTDELETMNCTVFGTINAIEVLFNFLYRENKAFSERFIGVLAETTQNGNDPHKVAEVIRKSGLIEETSLPFSSDIDTWEKYYFPNPMTVYLKRLGQRFLKQFEFKHEWCFREATLEEKIKMMKEALKRGPVAISVYAWATDENGISYKAGPENHWVMCYGFRDDIRVWKLFDTYDNCYKLYSFDSDITQAKVYWLKKKVYNKEYWFVDLFKRLCGIS